VCVCVFLNDCCRVGTPGQCVDKLEGINAEQSALWVATSWMACIPSQEFIEEFEEENEGWVWARNSLDVKHHVFDLVDRFWKNMDLNGEYYDCADDKLRFVCFHFF